MQTSFFLFSILSRCFLITFRVFKQSALLTAFILSFFVKAHAVEIPMLISSDGKSLETKSEVPWKIFANELTSLNDGVVLEARGNVLLVRGEDYMKADFARLYTNTQWILLQGNVVAKLGVDEVQASEAEFDLANSTGWVRDAEIFMAGPHMYFSSEELYKDAGDTYRLKNAVVTVCDGDIPLWSLSAEKARVEADYYAHFSNATFNIKNTPVIYTPYMLVPTKTTRQTGLLQPSYGVSSSQGVYYTQPWFYVIDQSRDITLYGTIMTERGFMPSIEYRSHTKQNQKMWAAFDMLHDKDIVLSDAEDDIDVADGKIRNNHLRYWLRAMGNGDVLETKWQYKFNLDYVSDQNFLREYQHRMTGFENSRAQSYKMFGRDFAEFDQNRVTEAYLYKDWDRFSVSAGFRYEQDPSLGNGNMSHSLDTTVQQLPSLYAFWNKGRIVDEFPLTINGLANTSYMFRQEGTSGFRSEISPTLSLPLDFRFFTMEAYAGLNAIFYHNTSEKRSAINKISDKDAERAVQNGTSSIVPEFGVDVYTQATRVWEWPENLVLSEENIGESQYTGMRHLVQPRLSYHFMADVNQEDNPYYVIADRRQDANAFYFSLDNHFTFRKNTVKKDKDGLSFQKNYVNLFRLKLTGGYDFREANRTKYTDTFDLRPWHDIRLRVEANPYDNFTLFSDMFYSPYDGKLTRFDSGLTLKHSRYGYLSSSYSLRESTYNYRSIVNYENILDIVPTQAVDVIRNFLSINFTPQIKAYWEEVTNLADGKSYERIVGLRYLHQCFRLSGEYSKDAIEESFYLSIEFTGLGI